jgi:hypothetical protein
MVVTLAGVFVALDASSRFRCIYAPGSMTPGGWGYHVGVPDKLVVSGRSLEITMEGPSRECFITDPDGHIFICPPIGKSATLNL